MPANAMAVLIMSFVFMMGLAAPAMSQALLAKVELNDAASNEGARCLDGSPPVYYFRPGYGQGSKSYILFLEGGGWCAGLTDNIGGFDSCLSRSITAWARAQVMGQLCQVTSWERSTRSMLLSTAGSTIGMLRTPSIVMVPVSRVTDPSQLWLVASNFISEEHGFLKQLLNR